MNQQGKYTSERFRKGVAPDATNQIFQRNIDRLMDVANSFESRIGSVEKNIGTENVTTMAKTITNNKSESEERHLMMGFE